MNLFIEKAFKLFTDGIIKGDKDFNRRLKGAGEVLSDFLKSIQMKTDNGKGKRKRIEKTRKKKKEEKEKKKRKKPKKTKLWQGLSDIYIPPEIFLEIALFIPYPDLPNFMTIDSLLYDILNNHPYLSYPFWKRKFKTEYGEGFLFPKVIDDFDYYNKFIKKEGEEKKYPLFSLFEVIKSVKVITKKTPKNPKGIKFVKKVEKRLSPDTWNDLNRRFISRLNVIKERVKISVRHNWINIENWIQNNEQYFEVGNELILKELLIWIKKDNFFYRHVNRIISSIFIKKYFQYNKALNENFLVYIMKEDEIFKSNELFKELFTTYDDRVFDKKKFFIEYLKLSYDKKFYFVYSLKIFEYVEEVIENFEHFYKSNKYLFSDEEFIKEAIKINGYILDYVNDDYYKNNKGIILKAIKTSNNVFKKVDENLKEDKTFVWEALKINPYIFAHLTKKLIGDENFVREFANFSEINKNLISYADFFRYFSVDVRNNSKIYLYFLENYDIINMRYAGPIVKNDVDLFYLILKNFKWYWDLIDMEFLKFAGEKVTGNFEFMKYALESFKNEEIRNLRHSPIHYATTEVLIKLMKIPGTLEKFIKNNPMKIPGTLEEFVNNNLHIIRDFLST